MTWLQFLVDAVRSYMINKATQDVLTDIDTNGLSTADEAIIDAYLATTKP